MNNEGTRLQITNAKEVIDTYTNLPTSINSELKKAMRVAAKPAVAEIKATLHQKSRRFVKAKIYGKTGINLMVGLFEVKGTEVSRYRIEYFKEYGTLANRLASHNFKNPRKSISSNWRGGIMPRHQISPLLDQKIPQIIDRLDKALSEKNINIK